MANFLTIYASTVCGASFDFFDIFKKLCIVFEQRIEGEINFSSQSVLINSPSTSESSVSCSLVGNCFDLQAQTLTQFIHQSKQSCCLRVAGIMAMAD